MSHSPLPSTEWVNENQMHFQEIRTADGVSPVIHLLEINHEGKYPCMFDVHTPAA